MSMFVVGVTLTVVLFAACEVEVEELDPPKHIHRRRPFEPPGISSKRSAPPITKNSIVGLLVRDASADDAGAAAAACDAAADDSGSMVETVDWAGGYAAELAPAGYEVTPEEPIAKVGLASSASELLLAL
ncbi:MAG TPA: hypothetical protein VMU87_01365 [Stellaceae bacterium]|nr:hypothetical protein [Stellaceae bacterium]